VNNKYVLLFCSLTAFSIVLLYNNCFCREDNLAGCIYTVYEQFIKSGKCYVNFSHISMQIHKCCDSNSIMVSRKKSRQNYIMSSQNDYINQHISLPAICTTDKIVSIYYKQQLWNKNHYTYYNEVESSTLHLSSSTASDQC